MVKQQKGTETNGYSLANIAELPVPESVYSRMEILKWS